MGRCLFHKSLDATISGGAGSAAATDRTRAELVALRIPTRLVIPAVERRYRQTPAVASPASARCHAIFVSLVDHAAVRARFRQSRSDRTRRSARDPSGLWLQWWRAEVTLPRPHLFRERRRGQSARALCGCVSGCRESDDTIAA